MPGGRKRIVQHVRNRRRTQWYGRRGPNRKGRLEHGTAAESEKAYVSLVEENLKELTSPFAGEISTQVFGLTQREIEICNMIKGGLTSKEIASLLDVSSRTVETHRNNIRKKLDIANQRINLATYLQEAFPQHIRS